MAGYIESRLRAAGDVPRVYRLQPPMISTAPQRRPPATALVEERAVGRLCSSSASALVVVYQRVSTVFDTLSELGVIAALGTAKVAALIEIVRDEEDVCLPKAARLALAEIAYQIEALTRQIDKLKRGIVGEAKRDEDMRRLTTIPGVGAITAASVKALVPDPGGFKSGRHFAAWLGLTPKPHSSGGKERLGGISKMGNPTLRSLLVCGATSVLQRVKGNDKALRWLVTLLARRPFKVVAVALANKMARIIWALLTKGGTYRNTGAASGAARA
ncbi:IS110 family transposase [Mesorhizobium sp. M0088]|uniref:IS110 family transposase n=1 Tax=Mesorhizobium sp. M0088 TaxID=2956873 RepID=UPI00333B0980